MTATFADSLGNHTLEASPPAFCFEEAFSRTIGWVTEPELALLRTKCVAIAGLGGVGGSHLLTLTRLGIGNFHLADLDHFELANFNRQAGASVSHLGLAKVEAMSKLALDINPTLTIRQFASGVTSDNVEEFLDGVDLYVDGLDFFAIDARRAVFAACERRGIPAVTVAPLGMTAALLVFMPGKMTFEQYFQLEGRLEHEQLLRFLVGLAPRALHSAHLVLIDRLNLAERRGPSTPMACELCAAVAGTETLKILLRRGRVRAAPHGVQIDAFGNRIVRTFRPLGNGHPLQRLALYVGRRRIAALVSAAAAQGAGREPSTR
jgi:molybdopterin/thiamine biosynthesis adenylyltransferase